MRQLIISAIVAVVIVTCLLVPLTQKSGSIIEVPPNGNLQAALDSAQPGDVIVLTANADYTCDCVLPVKSGSSHITIRSSRAGEIVGRVNPATQSALLARVRSVTAAEPVFKTVSGSHHYTLVGLDLAPSSSNVNYGVVRFGDSGTDQDTLVEVPHDLTVDRSWIHCGATQDCQRGVTVNSAITTIINSYVSDIHWRGVEAHAIGGWNGPGPFTITNNYLEAAGINILFGGARPSIVDLVPSDIAVSGNTLYKPLSWRVGDPSYAGIHWTVKNLFELKNARRVTVENNLMENSWADAQVGWGVIFNTIDEDVPWSVIEDVVFRRNVIRHSGSGIDLRGAFALCEATRMKRITISDNLLDDIGAFNGDAKPLLLLNGTEDVTIEHNTISPTNINTVNTFMMLDTCGSLKHVRLNVNSNLASHGMYGVFGNGGTIGTSALDRFASSWSFLKNALYNIGPSGVSPSQYPANNYFPVTLNDSLALLGVDTLPVGVRAGSGPTPTPTPTPTPSPTPIPTPTPGNTCKPNQLISSGCICLTKIVGPANKRRCK